MSSEDWQILERAFAAAAKLTGTERDNYVRDFTRQHPQLGEKLAGLLRADDDQSLELDAPIRAAADSLTNEADDIWIGRQLGVWRIKERLAVGGMGAVFLAHRADDQYAQTVAVKIMAAQLLSPDAISRFRVERQILASLSHPNIASLIDGGSTDERLPYLVMEYVDGLPIDTYCNSNNLGLRQRLRLFQRVCDALDYAHRNLVVHRDIKPGNILVDHHGEPKLLDFGIAKLLDAGSYDLTQALTRADSRALTPNYASPEHVLGQPVSIASDIYSLGVLLYELLTGQSPYRQTLDSRRSIELAILETDPERPSAAVTREGSVSIAPPERLRRQMSGDLDNIVLKALQKQPERRYLTAAEFRDDIERYLTQRPVSARPDSFFYRAGKFIRRNALGVATAAVFGATVVGLVTFYTTRLAVERDAAELEAQRSDEIATFMTSLFENASPHRSKGTPVTAVELLEQGFERIESLDVEPALQAGLMESIASNMMALGRHDLSLPMSQRSLEILESQSPTDDLAISVVVNTLGETYRQMGQLELSEPYQRRAVAMATDIFGPEHENVAYFKMRLGVTLYEMRRTEEAIALKQEALDQLVALGLGESPAAIDARGNLANALVRVGRYREAEAMHRQTIELSDRIDGELAPNTLIRKSTFSALLTRIGKHTEAAAFIDTAIAGGRRVWPENYDVFAYFYSNKCAIYNRLGRFDIAIPACETATAVAETNFGTENRLYARMLRGQAASYVDIGNVDAAARAYAMAVTAVEAATGTDSAPYSVLQTRVAKLRIATGELAEAEALLRDALEKPDHLGRATTQAAQHRLAVVLSRTNRPAEAAALFEETLADMAAGMGELSGLLPILGDAIAHYRRHGDNERALLHGQRVLDIIDADAEPLSWRGAVAMGEHAITLAVVGENGARELRDTARQTLARVFGDSDPRVLALDAVE